MNKIIEVLGLEKSYSKIKAVNKISFYVEEGALFAFLGVNGAGKSTTMDMLSTQLLPDGGKVIIDGLELGKDDEEIRSKIGIVFQDSVLDDLLTVSENLFTRGKLYKLTKDELEKAVDKAIKTVGLEDLMNRPYGKLSGGQRRRCDIARALINTPKILFLDEPTTGLDPQTRKNVWETIKRIQKDTGMTVFLTTHYMEEAAQADYITIIGKGEIKAMGSPIKLKEIYSTDLLKIKSSDNDKTTTILKSLNAKFEIINGLFEIQLKLTTEAIKIIELCKDNIENLEVLNGTMDDVFINVTKDGVLV